jgi:hypothetical protein
MTFSLELSVSSYCACATTTTPAASGRYEYFMKPFALKSLQICRLCFLLSRPFPVWSPLEASRVALLTRLDSRSDAVSGRSSFKKLWKSITPLLNSRIFVSLPNSEGDKARLPPRISYFHRNQTDIMNKHNKNTEEPR